MLMRQPIGEAPVTVGRSSDNTLKLVDPEISRHHCKIEWRDNSLFITDLSMNGTLVNGQQFKCTEVHVGDKLTIGPWTLSIDSTIDAVPIRTIAKSASETRVIGFDARKKILTTRQVELAIQSPDQAPIRRRMTKEEIVIGHHAACDVAVADPFVSRRHCRIICEGDVLRLVDLSSTNGTFVSDTKVTETILPSSGSFRIGRSTVLYRILDSSERISPSKRDRLGKLLGESRRMREIFAIIERIGPTDAAVCITGESGTGKELVARELHNASKRRRGNFVAVNCGAMPPSIIESQLFGHERGAFTGAVERVSGLFEQAKGGTIFLDEIGEMPFDLQARLLRVLETKTVRRIGGQEEIAVDVRLICATNRDLKRMVADGRFREDLFFRIFVVPIELPPLRERTEEIPALATHLLYEIASPGHMATLTEAAMERLMGHSWPGNVRELKNTLERTVLLSDGSSIDASDLKIESVGINRSEGGKLKEHERDILISALEESGGNLSRTSKKLGIARTTLQKKVKRYSIEVPRLSSHSVQNNTHSPIKS